MHHHALRFIDNGKIVVLPYYFYRDVLRLEIEFFRRGIVDDDFVADL